MIMDRNERPQGTQSSIISWYIGTAAEDLADGSIELKVYCPQLVPAGTGGLLTGSDTPVTISGTTYGKSAPQTDTVQSGSTVVCTYYGSGDLPLSVPPKIRKGESIEVRQYDTSNIYYWRPRGANNDLRTVDHLLLTVGASPSIGAKTTDNSYCLHIDPLTKQFVLSTSKVNGEQMAFTVTMDGQTGDFGIVNSDKDSISILKKDNTISLKNSKDASVIITGKNVTLTAPEEIVMTAKRIVTNLKAGAPGEKGPRHGTAYEDFYDCMEIIVQCFEEILARISYAPQSHGRILPRAEKAILEDDEAR